MIDKITATAPERNMPRSVIYWGRSFPLVSQKLPKNNSITKKATVRGFLTVIPNTSCIAQHPKNAARIFSLLSNNRFGIAHYPMKLSRPLPVLWTIAINYLNLMYLYFPSHETNQIMPPKHNIWFFVIIIYHLPFFIFYIQPPMSISILP